MKRRILFIIALIGAAAAGVYLTDTASRCPSVDALRAYRPPEASRIYAADGSLVADLSPQRRVVVELAEVPAVMRDGIVAVEDRRFWSHAGVDFRGVLRAVWRDLVSLSFQEGFSTITMQLARNVFPEELPRAKKISRKVCEVVLAYQIEGEFSKDEILALYLNQIYLGDGLYGVEAAAQGYFGKSARELTTAEAALLAGLPKSPEGYNPRKHPMDAVRRRNTVLGVMAREGVISHQAAEAAMDAPLALAPPPEAAGSAPYFVAAVRQELRQRFGPDADIQGLRVYTDLDPALQEAARTALVEQIERIEAGRYGRYRHPTPGTDAAPGDDEASPYLQGLVVALDPRTGAVRALVGGRDFAASQFNRALQAKRQPGSAFKPIVYAAAIADGLPVSTRIEATPVSVDDGEAAPWTPGDHVADSVETLSLREALAVSSNNAAVRVGQWAGEKRVAETAAALGISTPVPDYPSIHLGTAEVIPAELVAAYAAFGNGGVRVEPRLITRVEDAEGRVLWRAPTPRERALDEGTAFLTVSLLQDVVNRGTGAAVRRAGFDLPAAGKTGTTNDGKDVWFVGLTPDLVAGVWLGFDRPRPILPGASGGRLAAPVWADLMKRAYRDRPDPDPWRPPATLEVVAVDTASGLRATGDCPRDAVRMEYFRLGTAPMETCPLHPESGVERLLERVWDGIRGIFGGSDDSTAVSPRL